MVETAVWRCGVSTCCAGNLNQKSLDIHFFKNETVIVALVHFIFIDELKYSSTVVLAYSRRRQLLLISRRQGQ